MLYKKCSPVCQLLSRSAFLRIFTEGKKLYPLPLQCRNCFLDYAFNLVKLSTSVKNVFTRKNTSRMICGLCQRGRVSLNPTREALNQLRGPSIYLFFKKCFIIFFKFFSFGQTVLCEFTSSPKGLQNSLPGSELASIIIQLEVLSKISHAETIGDFSK